MVTQGGGLVHGREQGMEGGGAPGDAQIVLLSECWLNRCCFHFENSLKIPKFFLSFLSFFLKLIYSIFILHLPCKYGNNII